MTSDPRLLRQSARQRHTLAQCVRRSHTLPALVAGGAGLRFRVLQPFLRRALEAGATLDYTLPDLRELIEFEMQTPCIYCDQEITVQNFSIDHSQPTSRDGAHRFVNIHVCCMRCNQIKGALTAGEFTQLRQLLDSFEPAARRDILARLRAGGRSIHARAGHA